MISQTEPWPTCTKKAKQAGSKDLAQLLSCWRVTQPRLSCHAPGHSLERGLSSMCSTMDLQMILPLEGFSTSLTGKFPDPWEDTGIKKGTAKPINS